MNLDCNAYGYPTESACPAISASKRAEIARNLDQIALARWGEERRRYPRLSSWLAPERTAVPVGYPNPATFLLDTHNKIIRGASLHDDRDVVVAQKRFLKAFALSQNATPTLFVTKSLAQDLFATRPPHDWKLSDMQMPFEGLRFILQNDSMTTEDGHSLRSVDFCRIRKGSLPRLPKDVEGEMLRYGFAPTRLYEATPTEGDTYVVEVGYQDTAGRIKSGNLARELRDDEEMTVGDMITCVLSESQRRRVLSDSPIAGGDSALTAILISGLTFAVNAVVMMTARREYVEGGEPIHRPAHKNLKPGGETHRPRLFGAKHVAVLRSGTGSPTGVKLPYGWRAGHYRFYLKHGDDGQPLLDEHGHPVVDKKVWIEPYEIARAREKPQMFVGRSGVRSDFAVTLMKVSDAKDSTGMKRCVFCDDAGNVLTTTCKQAPVPIGDPSILRATVMRHYVEAKKPRTEISDCEQVFTQVLAPPPPCSFTPGESKPNFEAESLPSKSTDMNKAETAKSHILEQIAHDGPRLT